MYNHLTHKPPVKKSALISTLNLYKYFILIYPLSYLLFSLLLNSLPFYFLLSLPFHLLSLLIFLLSAFFYPSRLLIFFSFFFRSLLAL